jgi:hypothetical protein
MRRRENGERQLREAMPTQSWGAEILNAEMASLLYDMNDNLWNSLWLQSVQHDMGGEFL